MIDVSQIPRASVSVENVAFSAAADLFVLHTNDFFGSTVDQTGLIIPISLVIAQRDGLTIPGNEHIGVSVRALADATVTGTATAYSVSQLGRGELGALLDVTDLLDTVFTVEVMCGTLTTAADGERKLLSDAWNLQAPYQYVWGDDRPYAALYDDGAGTYQSALAVRLENAPSAEIDINATLTVGFLGAYRFTSD
jgi:hypothetical protein